MRCILDSYQMVWTNNDENFLNKWQVNFTSKCIVIKFQWELFPVNCGWK